MSEERSKNLTRLLLALKEKVKCPICLDPIRNSVELNCSHRFCESCLNEYRNKKSLLCPLCKRPIKRRTFYKDQFGNKLGNFLNKANVLINQHSGVEEHQTITNVKTTKRNCSSEKNINKAPSISSSEDAFNNLAGRTRRCYVNKRSNVSDSHFQTKEARTNIINWLNCTQKPFEDIIDSQNDSATVGKTELQKSSNRIRSQSLSLDCGNEDLQETLVKRYHSLSKGLNEGDNYNIEDVDSEKLVKNVERRVVQSILEDEYLQNLEKLTNEVRKTPNKKPRGRPKTIARSSSAGWERVRDVKRTIKKASKVPKKLNISLQTTQEKNDAGQNKRKAEVVQKKSPQISTKEPVNENNENGDRINLQQNKTNQVENKNNSNTKVYNLSVVEKYFLQNLCNSNNEASKTSDDRTSSELINDKNKNIPVEEDDLYTMLTQKTNENVFVVPPAPDDVNMDHIVKMLLDNLDQCIAQPFNDQFDKFTSFTNLKTYVSRIQEIILNKSDKETQTITDNYNIETQTDIECHCQETQTSAIIFEPEVNSVEPERVSLKPVTQSNPLNVAYIEENIEQSKNLQPVEVASQKNNKISLESVLVVTVPINTDQVNENIKKLALSTESQFKKFKRIRVRTSESDSESEGHIKKRGCNRFIREDLSIRFDDSEDPKVINRDNKTPDSENIDYDEYLKEVMDKYDTSPKCSKINSQTTKISTKVTKIQSQPKSQKASENFEDHVFTASNDFQDQLNRFDKEISQFEKQCKEPSLEYDVIEDTPAMNSAAKRPRIAKKVLPLDEPIKIISKKCVGNRKIDDLPKSAENIIKQVVKENVGTEITADVAGLLEDLKNDSSFFEENIESQPPNVNTLKQSVKRSLFSESLFHHSKSNTSKENTPKELNVTTENIDRFVQNLNNFEDEALDFEMEQISLGAGQRKGNNENIVNEIVDISDSDEELVETTPQKKRLSADKSIFDDVSEPIDICLPPPPGFGNDSDQDTPLKKTGEESVLASLTPDGLSALIVTPEAFESRAKESEPENSQHFNLSMVISTKTPKMDRSLVHSTPKGLDHSFFSQRKYTPLVTASKLSTKKNLMTSTPNQKSILNYVKSSQESVSASQKSKPCIMWSRIINKDQHVFTKLKVKKLVTVSESFGPEVTHLIVVVDEKGRLKSHTAKYLLAVAAGLWVVRYEWAQDCLKYNKIVPEEPYEALDSSGVAGPQISRLMRLVNPLFKDYHFYCAPPFSVVSRMEIENAVQMLGATTVSKPELLKTDNDHIVSIILTDTTATEDMDMFEHLLDKYKTVTVDVEWLTKCIGQYKIVSFRPYLLCSDESICDLGYPPVLLESVPFTLTETTTCH